MTRGMGKKEKAWWPARVPGRNFFSFIYNISRSNWSRAFYTSQLFSCLFTNAYRHMTSEFFQWYSLWSHQAPFTLLVSHPRISLPRRSIFAVGIYSEVGDPSPLFCFSIVTLASRTMPSWSCCYAYATSFISKFLLLSHCYAEFSESRGYWVTLPRVMLLQSLRKSLESIFIFYFS